MASCGGGELVKTLTGWELVEEFLESALCVAFDDCHKIYLLESENDLKEAQDKKWTILPIDEIEQVYNDACPLKFINTWNL